MYILISSLKSLSMMRSKIALEQAGFIKISRAIFLIFFSKFNALSKLALSEWTKI